MIQFKPIGEVKPSKLLTIAMEDKALCEADPRYKVNMQVWHDSDGHNCEVCLSGCVMAKTAKIMRSSYNPSNFTRGKEEQYFSSQLLAINSFRVGMMEEGLGELGIELPYTLKDYYTVTSYNKNKEQFDVDMFKIIKLLKEADL